MTNLFTSAKRAGLFGGPAKIHQMFEDGHNPSTPPIDHKAELIICALSAVAAIACFFWIKDDPSTK
jgi:hypothetical protein